MTSSPIYNEADLPTLRPPPVSYNEEEEDDDMGYALFDDYVDPIVQENDSPTPPPTHIYNGMSAPCAAAAAPPKSKNEEAKEEEEDVDFGMNLFDSEERWVTIRTLQFFLRAKVVICVFQH